MTAPFEPLVGALVEVVRPLRTSLRSADDFGALLARHGWIVDIDDSALDPINATFAVEPLLAAVESNLKALLGADATARDAALAALLQSAVAVVERLSKLTGGPSGLGAPFDQPDFWPEFGSLIATDLLVSYLERRQPGIFSALHLCGAIRIDWVTSNTPGRTDFERATLDWNQLAAMLGNPVAAIQSLYRWGQPAGLDHPRLFKAMERAALAHGLAAVRTPPVQRPVLTGLKAASIESQQLEELWIPLIQGVSASQWALWRVGLALIPLPEPVAGAGVARGLAVTPVVEGGASLTKRLTESVSITFSGALDARKAIAFRLYPDRLDMVTTEPAIAATIELNGHPPTPWVLLGSADGSRFEADGMRIVVGFAGQPSDPEIFLGVGTGDAPQAMRLVVALGGDGDAFARQIVGDGFRVEIPFNLLWSSKKGVQLEGGIGIDFSKTLHKSLGPFTLNRVHITAHGTLDGAELTAGIGFTGKLGPLLVSLDDVGLKATMRPASKGDASFGNIGLAFGIKPPSGVGLLVDAGAVTGGGYLSCADGFYSGALQIAIKNTFSLKAVGFISTKRPDGTAGFSMVIAVSAEFSPIQLGYGFTLNGVGGLAAFNRTMNVDALRDGIKNHTLDSIMFPPNPVANASKIISDLMQVFPDAPGRFVFAPMVKIGWGASVLLIEVGLAVELPSPLRLVIMGKVHLLLPPTGNDAQKKPDKAVEIHLDVLGILDLDRNEISVDAVLYDSRLAIFPITGGMALRIKWGADPMFLLAIGGFNPRFAPPPGFPTLDRVGIQLAYDKNGLRAGLLLTSYVAVTSSTVQFGARIDAYAEVSIAKIAGYLGFDALVEMAPFHIIVDVYGGVTVRAFGIGFSCDLLLTLTAFDPVTGDGHLTIDFFGKHEVPIHFAIGDAKPLPALPVADPLAELVTALSDIRNWSAALPMGAGMLVTFRQPTADELKASAGQVLAHPMGELSVRQKVLPFDIGIDRFGAAVPMSRGPFAISEATFGAQTSVVSDKTAKLRDSFARGQFVTLSEDDKLTGPQFESFVNGYAGLGTDQVRLVAPQTVAFDYDVLVIDSVGEQTQRPLTSATLSYGAMLRATQFSASKAGSVDIGAPDRFTGTSKGISVVAPKYKVISVDQVDPNDKTEFDTWTQADEKRRTGAKVSRRQVVESHEFA